MSLFVVEGQTAPIHYRLLADNVAYPLVGSTVTLVARNSNGTVKTFNGTVSIVDGNSGWVSFAPDAADLVATDYVYHVRFRVVRADGKIEFFPTGEPELWVVQK